MPVFSRTRGQAFLLSSARLTGLSILLLCLNVLTATAADIELRTSQHKVTKLKSWFVTGHGFALELTQRLPDQNRAFFMSQGYSEKLSNVLGTSCIFKTVIQNKNTATSGKTIAIDMSQWIIEHDNKKKSMYTREYWGEQFVKKHKLEKNKALVLQWGFYPTKNLISPGDYNWGLSSFGLPPGAKFNLILHWSIGAKHYQYKVANMNCPPDKDRL